MKPLKYILPIFIFYVTGNSGLQAQTSNITDFVTTWKTTTANESITIPTFPGIAYNYTVDWGDATTMSTGVTGNAMHSYASAGEYEVRISGTFPRIYINNAGDKDKLIDINQWGNQVWTSMASAFRGATNLLGAEAGDSPDLTGVTDMDFMFAGATSYSATIASWDVSNVTSMRGVFQATSISQSLSGWNTSNVTTMSEMFQGSLFDHIIDVWNVSSVTDMSNMFNDATSFNSSNITAWNVSNVTDMSSMFDGATAFNQNIGGWTVSNVADMSNMFNDATAFDQDIGDWDVGRVTTMSNMFTGVTLSPDNYDALLLGWSTIETGESALQTGITFHAGNSTFCNTTARTILMADPGANWTITDGGTNPTCDASLSTLSLSPGVVNETFVAATTNYTASVATVSTSTIITAPTTNTAAAIVISGTDTNGDALSVNSTTVSGLTIGANIITIVVTAQDGATTKTYTLTLTRAALIPSTGDFVTTWRVVAGDLEITIPTTGTGYNYTVDWGDTTPATDHSDTDATHTYTAAADYEVRIIGDFPRIYFNNAGDKDKIIDIKQWGDQQWTSMERSFNGATNMTVTATDAPDLSNVTDMRFMFDGVTAFNQPVNHWDVSNIVRMRFMFRGATAFNQDLGGWNVSSVANMQGTFDGATAFNQDIGGWDVSAVGDMQEMFQDATVFNQDIGMWNVGAVTKMNSMFQDATAFDQDLGTWNVSSVTTMANMLDNCGMTITNYDNLLTGWAALTLQSNVTLGAAGVNFCTTIAATARNVLTATGGNNWMITDAGLLCSVATDITAFSFTGQTGAAVIDEVAHTVVVQASPGTTLTALVPTIAVSPEATIAPASGAAQDFTNDFVYTVTAQDGMTTRTWMVTVNVPPADIALANSTIAENNAVNDVIGGLSATDGNTSDTHTYSLAAGTGDTDNASFSISGNDLVAAVVFDHETKSAYSVRIAAADDNGGTFEKAFALTVNNVPEISQTITFGALAAMTFGGADFNLTATASSTLNVSYMSSDPLVASIAGSTVTIVGAGTTDITASQAGDDDYIAAPDAMQNLVVNQADQTITLTPVTDKGTIDPPFDVIVSSTSRLPVMLRVSGPATISGTTLTLDGDLGIVTITASQAGNDNYNAAPPVVQSFEVVTKANQTIDFGALAAVTFGGADFNLAATASSTLNVSYSSSDPSVASIAGNMVTIVGAGTTVITASQAGDIDYIAAPDVMQNLVVNQADQTITLTPVADKVTTDAPFDVAVSSTSGLAVTLTVNGPATISATTLTLTGTSGTVTITASQAGNDNYNAATSVEESFDVVDMRTVTGLEEEAPDKIILHPIPANNTIYIDMGDQKLLEMTVTDLNGKQMTVHAQDSQLDISSLKQGYYILRITTDQGVFSQKIIKQ